MSEFYFDYRCISLAADADKNDNKALDFFLAQNYENGAMNVQVYVPLDLQNKHGFIYDHVRVYQAAHGVDFSHLLQSALNGETKNMLEPIPMHGDLKAIDRENGFIIPPIKETLNCVGVIAFMRKGHSKALEEDCFKFAINFGHRQLIPYRILEKKRKIVVEIKYPRLLDDIELYIVHKANAKPLLVGDSLNENNIVVGKNNKPVIITLKKMGKESTWLSEQVNFKLGTTSTNDYRLYFKNENDSLFYLLDDESDFTIEDQKERKKAITKKNSASSKAQGLIKCPYCNRTLPEELIKAKKGVFNCNGSRVSLYGIKGFGNGKKAIVCTSNLKEASLLKPDDPKSKDSAIVAEKLLLPAGSDKYPSINIALAGFPNCGKTVYLASIINMFTAGERSYNANPFILKNITEHFSSPFAKNKNVEMVKMLDYDLETEKVLDRQESRRSMMVEGMNIKGRYTINVGQKMESHTDADKADLLAWNPIGFQAGELGFIYLYDVPGECCKKPNKPLRTFSIADGIIAIIDGEELSASRGAGVNLQGSKSMNPINNLFDTLENIHKLAGNRDLTDVPIAIVFSKLDLKIWQYVESNDPKVRSKCFDDNCHVLREDMISLFPKNRRYRGSEIERHIDCSSYEIQHFLKNLSTEEKSAFDQIMKKYHNIKFFACSSVGSDSVFQKVGDGSSVIRRPRRLRIELPLIWLMHKKGLVRD